MQIIHVTLKIEVITDLVFPKPPLPETAFLAFMSRIAYLSLVRLSAA